MACVLLCIEGIDGGYITIKIRVADALNETFVAYFNITIKDANDNPESVSLDENSLNEAAESGTIVGVLSVEDEDADDTHTFEVQTPKKGFSIKDETLVFVGDSGGFVDYERANEVTVVVRAKDQAGGHVDQEIVLTIEDGNDAPFFKTTTYIVDENSRVGSVAVKFELGDEDMLVDKPWLKRREPQTIELEAADGSLGPFTLVGHTLVLSSGVDHEETAFYKFEVSVVDSDGVEPAKTTEVCTVTVRDTGEPPSLVKLSNSEINEMAERSATKIGSVIGKISIFDEDLVIQPTVTVDSPADQIFSVGELAFKMVRGSDWPGELKADRSYTQCTVDLKVRVTTLPPSHYTHFRCWFARAPHQCVPSNRGSKLPCSTSPNLC